MKKVEVKVADSGNISGGIFVFSKKTFMIAAAICIFIGLICYYSMKSIFYEKPSELNGGTVIMEDGTPKTDIAEVKENVKEEEPEAVTATTEQKITPSTKMIYQYYYPADDVMKEQEEEAPYFLLDLTLSDMKKYYSNWSIISFSENEVVMRKTVEDDNEQRYIVGEQDGYIAVFYEEEKNGISLHELTDTPTGALSHEEQVRLNDGIPVTGDEELAKILEDYGS